MNNLLICSKSNDELPRIFDIYQEIKENCLPEESNFVSTLLNWFGKTRGLKFNPKKKIQEDLFTFLYDLTKNSHSFGWPLSRWEKMKSTGRIIEQYIKHCVDEVNQLAPLKIDKIITKFGKNCLFNEMINVAGFYSKVTKAELDKSRPLEMKEIVELSEKNSTNALRIFNQDVKDAFFSHQIVGEVESHLKNGINNHFRTLWLENAQNSESYCQNIFNSCFKWIKAEMICSDTIDEATLKERYIESVNLYLEHAKGTKKLQVLSFFSASNIDLLSKIYPQFENILIEIGDIVEKKTMQETLVVDQERKKIQKIGAYKLKLLTIENTIHRLSEEITQRKIQCDKSDEFDQIREMNLSILGIKCKNEFKKEFRKKFIESLDNSMKHEIYQFREYECQLKELMKE